MTGEGEKGGDKERDRLLEECRQLDFASGASFRSSLQQLADASIKAVLVMMTVITMDTAE